MENVKTANFSHVIELFETQVNQTPLHVAVSEQGKQYHYRALNEKANQLAYCLRKYQIQPGEFVGVLLEPGVDFIVCILAVVKLGAVYLPLDALAPQQRLVDILADAKPKLLITSDQFKTRINEANNVLLMKNLNMESVSYPRNNLQCNFLATAPLYMMYTSGSTGKPKGVIVPHQAVTNLVKIQNDFQLQEGDVIAQFSNLAFDASPFEIWSALLNGAHLAVVPLAIRTDPAQFKRFIETQNVRFLCLPTGFFHQLIKSAPETLNAIRVIVFGGEQVNSGLLKNFLAYRKEKNFPIDLINGYGPTETTAYTCRQRLNGHSELAEELLASIGLPIANTRLYVLDEQRGLADEGELYVSGINLALGYHNSTLQNNEKFIDNPFTQEAPYQRLYKTGDKVRRLASGEFLFLGRFDDQVKIGGFRIHLNEIEKQLMRYPGISLAAVKVEIGGGSHKMLTAYIAAAKEALMNADAIRAFLSKVLPPYMLPAKYVLVDELPLTLVGKVDKAKLDSLPHSDLSFHLDTSSSSKIEEKIKKIWQHLLNRPAIDTNKNLFELGANSLLITEACAKINAELQSELQVADILSHPTIYKLSCYLEGQIEAPAAKIIKEADTQDIAIIGMACRFPGADSLDEYWHNLCAATDSLQRVMPEQDDVLPQKANEHYVPVRGTLAAIDQFDANFFGFNPGDARIADPQQRLFLECAWEALEHAAVAPGKLKTSTISVFAGMADSSYLQENLLRSTWFMQEHDLLQQRIACSTSMLSTQVSYRLNLNGRSINVNTACSTGLVTVDQACQDLILGESDIALAGSVSIVVPQSVGYHYQPGSILSPDGSCRPFSTQANGTVFANGVGVVILKRLADAVAAGDTIYAVIKGRGVNNDGSDKLGFAAPSTSGQMACIRSALRQAKVSADEISYVEAHGTATALGDVVELGALTAVYREQTDKKQYCLLGSVKANIGHTDAAAGIAGLIKTALCLYHQKIPPLCGFTAPHPDLHLQESPFIVNTKIQEWPAEAGRRFAGVSSFGVGGTNVHMVLADYVTESKGNIVDKEQLLVFSAKTEQALGENSQKILAFLAQQEANNGCNLADAAYTLQMGREDFAWRHFTVGSSAVELKQNLTPPIFCDEHVQQNLVFMFPGQGMQYPFMAMELMEKVPAFAEIVEQGMSLAKNYLGCDLLHLLRNFDVLVNQTQYAQPALFIIEYALARVLMAYGIKPDALIGHSIGEYVAACLAGVFSFEDAVVLVCERGLLMAHASPGAMLAVECSAEEFAVWQQQIPVALALHNAPNHCVASGSNEEIALLTAHLAALGKHYHPLKVSHAFHSAMMDSVEQPFKDMLSNISLSAPAIPIISNVSGTWLSAEEATNPDYWYRHLRHTVQLCAGFATLAADKRSFFVEVGPGSSLSTFLKEVMAQHHQHAHCTQVLPGHRRQVGDYVQFLSALGSMWQHGIMVDWPAFYKTEQRSHMPLPTYPFQRQSYWVEPDAAAPIAPNSGALYKPVWSHQFPYMAEELVTPGALGGYDWVIFKDRQTIAEQFIGFLYEQGINPIIVEQGNAYVEHSATHFQLDMQCKAHYESLFNRLKPSLRKPYIIHAMTCDHSPGAVALAEVERQLALSFYSLLYLMQAYTQHVGEHIPLACTVVTQGTQKVTGSESMVPINATLLGSCRVLRQEHPCGKFKLIDILPNEWASYNGPMLHQLFTECLQEQEENLLVAAAYRQGLRWESTYAQVKLVKQKLPFRERGVYVLTGGLGGIALALCEAIARQVANPQFILLSRKELPPQSQWPAIVGQPKHPLYSKILALQQLRELGAMLSIHQADVTEPESLERVLRHTYQELGVIHGLIHTAGVAGSGLAQLKTPKTAQAVLLPKVHGTYNLARALANKPLDFVVLMSSIAAVTGEKGQVDYCAANASLDAVACANFFSTPRVFSLNWNTWREVGMAVETGRPEDVDYFNRGNDISPQQGQHLFLQAISQPFSNLVISNYEPQYYAAMLSRAPKDKTVSITTSRKELSGAGAYEAPANEVEERLALLWQETLGIDAVGRQDDFFALGGHSLKALSLIEKINKIYDARVSIQHLYQASQLAQFAKLIHSAVAPGNVDIIVPLKTEHNVSGSPVFFCHPASGLAYCFNAFTKHWYLPQALYGIQDPGLAEGALYYGSVKEMAKAYLKAIKKVQPQGPYFLVGYSFGGSVMYEIAHLLREEGEAVGLLALIESWSVFSEVQHNEHHFKELFAATHELSPALVDLAWQRMGLLLNNQPSSGSEDMLLFKARDLLPEYQSLDAPLNGWEQHNQGMIHCYELPANHETILNRENCATIADIIQKRIYNSIEPHGMR